MTVTGCTMWRMGKPKRIDPSQLPALLPGDRWERLQGIREALPKELQGIPDEKLYHVTVSGSLSSPRPETKYGVSGEIAVGLDVWRHDPKDAPFEFNKDHYFVTRTSGSERVEYLLHGPYRNGEPDHWREEIPDEYGECELLVSRRRSFT